MGVRLPQWMPFVSALGVVCSIWLVTPLWWQTRVRFAVWFVIGAGSCYGYAYKRSKPTGRQVP